MFDSFQGASNAGGAGAPPSYSIAAADGGAPRERLRETFKRAHDGYRQPIERLESRLELRPDDNVEYEVVKVLDDAARDHNARMDKLLRGGESCGKPENPTRQSGMVKAWRRAAHPEGARRGGDDHEK